MSSILLGAINFPALAHSNEPAPQQNYDEFQWSLKPEEVDVPSQLDPSEEEGASLHLIEV